MAELEEWSPDAEEWNPDEHDTNENTINTASQDSNQIENMQQGHPFLMALAKAIQKHPSLNKAINTASKGADVINKGTRATGLVNASRGLFQGGSDLLRGIAGIVPTGIAPSIDIPDPKFSEMPIEEEPIFGMGKNPLQHIGDPAGYASTLLAGALRAPGVVGHAAEALADIPISTRAGARALNRVRDSLAQRGGQPLNVSDEVLDDIINNGFLRNTRPNRNLLERAREGGYNDLFSLQSDLGQRERAFTRDIFNAANRQFGRDIGQTRQGLLGEMRQQLIDQGHLDLADLLRHGQNRYRQFMNFRPYRNAAVGAIAAGSPLYNKLRKFFP